LIDNYTSKETGLSGHKNDTFVLLHHGIFNVNFIVSRKTIYQSML